jgi:hypothetical protein
MQPAAARHPDTVVMPRRHLLAAALALIVATRAGAQPVSPVSLEASLGAGHLGGGAEFTSRGGFAVDALLGLRVAANRGRALVAGLNAGMQGPLGSNDMCTFTPRGGCMPDQPIFYTVGALAGWESRAGTVRALAGPAAMHADGGGRALGLQARLDGATPTILHVAAVLSVRGTLMPNYRGESLRLLAFGIGLRIR